jgi:hypothetical protein
VFTIASANTLWKLGRLEDRAKQMALQLSGSGTDLASRNNPEELAKREGMLTETPKESLSAPPPARRITPGIIGSNHWQIGELIGFSWLSGQWTRFLDIGQN